jgi:hypothetical protein
MKTLIFKNSFSVMALAVLYTFLFWHESMGINLVLFSSCIAALLLYRHREVWAIPRVQWTLAGTLFSGAMVLLWNSTTAVVAHIASFYLFSSLVHAPQVRAFHFSAAHALINQVKAPGSLNLAFHNNAPAAQRRPMRLGYWLRVVIIPLLFVLLFYILYVNANNEFAAISNRFWHKVFRAIDWFFGEFSFAMLFLFLSGVLICAGVVLRAKVNRAPQWDEQAKVYIGRTRRKVPHLYLPKNALKTEYRTACLLIAMVNVLLLAVNCTDIRYVWLNFEFSNVGSLSEFVHQGTYLLILSILLSKGFIIFYFRRNLNFYPNNRVLRTLAVVWMLQNVFLVMSVALRNWYYVQYYALAYKRIGVFIFLILVVVGLITMVLKIQRRHTGYQLLRSNAIAAYSMLILMSAVNWDPWIILYNLKAQHKAGFDASFCFKVSEKAIPLMLENMHLIEQEMTNGEGLMKYARGCSDIECFRDMVHDKAQYFMYKYESESVLSWNYADDQTYRYLRAYCSATTHDANGGL